MDDNTKLTTNLGLNEIPTSYAGSRIKRVFDLVVAGTLLLLTSPFLVPAIIVNFISTRGHPMFVQRRAGIAGSEFRLLKLRTMRNQQSGEPWLHRTERNDERLTLIGIFLRRTYIDELPQLLNVLAGSMSMIGPRPETTEMTLEISKIHSRFAERMHVKPGLTGVAQVFFRKPDSDQDLWRRYYYDHLYITRSSFIFDLEITLRTVIHVLGNKGH